jgi:streptomycin 6-kinase
MNRKQLLKRVEERAQAWGVIIRDSLETESSFVAFGTRGDQPVVLKIIRRPGDEWLSGKVLEAFGGNGMVRVYEYIDGALLLERLQPGTPLSGMALGGGDEEATEILADVIQGMSHPRESLEGFVTVEEWGNAFEHYLASGDRQIPKDLVEQAGRIYLELCASQTSIRLLHGDLQHYNILSCVARGWVAIDPKGVVGELEYEIGAALRNPYERPELFATPEIIKRRLRCYEDKLKLDYERALAWSFAQAVLSAIWSVEDGFPVDAENPALRLADAIRPLVR